MAVALPPGMRLVLEVPAGWFVERLRCGLTHYRDPACPEIRILTSALVPAPGDLGAWRRRELHALVPDHHELAVVAERLASGVLGWPLRVVEAETRRRGDPVERWLAVFYEASDRAGVALVRGPVAAMGAARTRELVDLLAAARPVVGERLPAKLRALA